MADIEIWSDPMILGILCLVAILSGFVKGVIGFAMPTIMIAGLGAVLPPDLALAGLILPTFVANIRQASYQGVARMIASVKRYQVFLIAGGISMLIAAQLYRLLPQHLIMLLIGTVITGFAVTQLMGLRLQTSAQKGHRAEIGFGTCAGFMGGVSGMWGPPTVAMLTAQNTPKHEQMQVQGVIYLAGSVVLLVSHIGSGVLDAQSALFSAMLIVPALIGQFAGGAVLDRIDQSLFRRLTLIMLVFAGLNLLRRAFWGG